MGLADVAYRKAPVFVQNLVCTAYGYLENSKRYNKHFEDFLSFFKCSDFFTAEQRDAYKRQKISSLLLGLKGHPYYSAFLSALDSEQIISSPYECLKAVPPLEKKTIQGSFDLFVVDSKDSFLIKTSGTTGSALKLKKTYKDMSAQTAAWFRHRDRFGVSFRDSSVNFTGKIVVGSRQKKPPFWRYNRAWNQYLINMQSINSDNIESIVEFLGSLRPAFYSGYPSIIGDLSRLALDKGLELKMEARPKVIFCGAENTLGWQEEAIRAWTGGVVTDLYGLTEGSCNLSKCHHGFYHEDFELCHSEIIEPEVLDGGRIRGKLVGTGFFLEAFPLLRYMTGDVAVQMPECFNCKCGRKGVVYESIEGRIDDYVVTPSGARIMRFDYLFKDTFEIKEAQVVQVSAEEVVFRIVLHAAAPQQELERKITSSFREWISPDMIVSFEYVSHIEKSATGKFKAVVGLG